MKKFRLPRKIKKKLKKGLWLYPADEKGNSLMAHPTENEKDYKALKSGKLKDLFFYPKKEEKEENALLDKEINIANEQLKSYVKDIFHENYRSSSYNTLLKAKNSRSGKKAYYNFINAYNMYLEDDSYGNTCSMSVDYAEELLRKEKNKGRVFNKRSKFKKKR